MEHAGVPFSGDDRLMADYLRTELLARLSDAEVSFLTRTSVLDRMSGPLCDAALDSTGSGALLQVARAPELVARRARSARRVVPVPSPVT